MTELESDRLADVDRKGLPPESEAWGAADILLAAAGGDPGAAADALLDELSGTELISMLGGQRTAFQEAAAALTGAYNKVPYPAASVARLGYPGVRFADGPRGIVVGRSTAFPSSMARGASFDPALEQRIGHAIGREGTAQGANLFAGICINLLRHPGWGRAQETYGEDPVLLGEMGAALTGSVGRHMATCIKHFALNSMENSRFFVDVRVDEADLADIYLPHFRRCVEAGADAVMSAYNKVNGQWAGHSHRLLTDILRDDWGFEGFVMSDFGLGVRDMVEAVKGGQDLEMPITYKARKLPAAAADGRISINQIRRSARRITATMFGAARRTGATTADVSVVGCDAHRSLAREAAAASFVLLANADVDGVPSLPLASPATSAGTVALVGQLAGTENTGDHGSSRVRSRHVVTAAEGLGRAAERDGFMLRESLTDDPDQAVGVARGADAAVVVVGTTWRDEGEYVGVYGGDRRSLTLTKRHEALIDCVAGVCARTIVVLVGGSAFICERWRRQVAAIVMTWYSGDEGGNALADVLLGVTRPGGRLPCTWPVSESQLPPYRRWARTITYGPLHGYRLFHATGRRPAFWFGEGLTYTTMEWGTPDLRCGDVTSVTVPVRNAGDRPGTEVVQVYVDVALGTHAEPLPTLAGFARVDLDPGQAGEVDAILDDRLCERARGQPTGGVVRIGRSADPDQLIVCGTLA